MKIAPEPRSRPAVGCRKAKAALPISTVQAARRAARLWRLPRGVPASKRGICTRFRAEESELTYALQENGSGISTSAGYSVR